MGFDIRQDLADETGAIDDDAAEEFEDELMDCFAASPEARPIIEKAGSVGWAHTVLEYGRGYEDVTVTTMDASALSGILLGVFPRKVSCEPSAAGEIVDELRAFWSFLRREFSLTNADECLAVLDDELTRTMERELADPSNFGMAKSIFMGGKAAGFDMTTQEGLNAFMRAYNASLPVAGVAPRPAPTRQPPLTQAEKNKKKAQRKAQRASRRKRR